MSTETTVSMIPNCDFCFNPASYDGKTKMGPWANMCEDCFKKYGVGLGTGKGQKFIATASYDEMANYIASHCNEEAL